MYRYVDDWEAEGKIKLTEEQRKKVEKNREAEKEYREKMTMEEEDWLSDIRDIGFEKEKWDEEIEKEYEFWKWYEKYLYASPGSPWKGRIMI